MVPVLPLMVYCVELDRSVVVGVLVLPSTTADSYNGLLCEVEKKVLPLRTNWPTDVSYPKVHNVLTVPSQGPRAS